MSNPLEPLLNEIIARLERGVAPWRQPWANGADPSTPLRSDGQPFSGSNAWLLAFAGAERGYASPFWFTFRQALAIGAPRPGSSMAVTSPMPVTPARGKPRPCAI